MNRMKMNINGKDIETRFGMAFIREINKNHLSKDSKTKEQYGVMFGYSFLEDVNPEGVAEVIHCATAHLKGDRPTKNEIDVFLDHADDLCEICNELKTELEEGTLTKKTVEKGKKLIEMAEMNEKSQKKVQKK